MYGAGVGVGDMEATTRRVVARLLVSLARWEWWKGAGVGTEVASEAAKRHATLSVSVTHSDGVTE